MLPENSGTFFTFEQPERIKTSRTLMLMRDGRLVRLMQSFKFKKMSFSAVKIDGWMLTKLVQSSSSNLLRFGMFAKFGVLDNF